MRRASRQTPIAGDDVECGTQRAAGVAARIATQGAADDFGIGAVLNGNAESNCGVARRGVGARIGLMIAEKHLADPPVGEARIGAGVLQTGAFELEALRRTAIRKAGALTHGVSALRA